jgi:hypothetical protein
MFLVALLDVSYRNPPSQQSRNRGFSKPLADWEHKKQHSDLAYFDTLLFFKNNLNDFISEKIGISHALGEYPFENGHPVNPLKAPKHWQQFPIIRVAQKFVALHGWIE